MKELISRREKVLASLKENSIAFIFAGYSKTSSEDEYLPFCINKNFYYLTNIEQENSVLVLIKGIGEETFTYLFVDEYNELKEKWTGKRLTIDEASFMSSVNSIYTMNSFSSMLDLFLASQNNQYGKIDKVYLDLSKEQKLNEENLSIDGFIDVIKEKNANLEIANIYPILAQLRMIKSPYEVEQIVKAINATNNGLSMLISHMSSSIYEYELNALFTCFGIRNGRHKLAFDTIIAAGKNATCLHYPTQDSMLKENDLVLCDLGYRHNQYCSDITRTYPVNGKFTGLQKTIYEAVLNCNKAVINHIRSGMSLKELNDFTNEFLKQECVRLNLIKPEDDIRKYYFHSISHHLGLDTHDVGGRDTVLTNGNIITVEPGLYFEEYGIGVRIEDDVLITNGLAEVLSKDIKKEIKDIEALFQYRYKKL